MAVVDTQVYANTSTVIQKALMVGGKDALDVIARFEVTSGETAASKYRIAKIPSSYVPIWGVINCDAIAGLTDVDLGFALDTEFEGTVKDADALVDGVDLHAGKAIGSGVDALSSLTIANIKKDVATLLSDEVSEYQTYDLILTTNETLSGSGTIAVRMRFVNGA